jgi:MFS family permease
MLKFRWAYVPPLLIYLSAGISGITSIVGIFFLKDYLNISAAFIASIGFWAGIPWALKMPVGFLIDRFWNQKHIFVYAGAVLIAISLFIMYNLLANRAFMETYLPSEYWYIVSTILTPIGYVLQDVVADAMTVEAVEPNIKLNHKNATTFNSSMIKAEHTIVQLYGRFAIILGSLIVGLINIYMFNGLEQSVMAINNIYANIYLIAIIIPFISVSGVLISRIRGKNIIKQTTFTVQKLDYQIFLGSLVFVIFAIFLGTLKFTFSREIVLITSLILISILMRLLIKNLDRSQKNTIIGTAIIIFVYRALPGPGAGLNWFEIDVLSFDQSFFSLLSVISAAITLIGILIFKNLMVDTALAKLFIILSILSAILYIPSVLLYYEVHIITSIITNGIVDARFIAILNTAAESPLSQIAMIPLLAWIAKNAPIKYKATFFAVFASFTNLALSAKELFTSYLNRIFIIKREVVENNIMIELADYTDLDNLLISIIMITLFIPLITILIIQKSKFKSLD